MCSCLEQQSWKQNTVLTHGMNKGTRMKYLDIKMSPSLTPNNILSVTCPQVLVVWRNRLSRETRTWMNASAHSVEATMQSFAELRRTASVVK